MLLTQQIIQYIEQHRQEAFDLLVEMAQIPAPSNHEEKRAAFCKEWLERQGAKGVYIDEALNVIYPLGCTADNPLVVYMAHSDVVFPDTEPLPLRIEDGRIYCPGVGDDTANAVALLMAAKYCAQHDLTPSDEGVLIVIDSGEEGLGNLKGCRKIMEDFGPRIREFVSLDGGSRGGTNRAVGSKRYRIAIDTEGGHSYGAFGNRNAIRCLASIIDTLYSVKVPQDGNSKTTYNVGTISGGTSVNTIAQSAEMLYEYRSDRLSCLLRMEEIFGGVIRAHRDAGVDIEVEKIGDRPCSASVDPARKQALIGRACASMRAALSLDAVFSSGSTDANVPLFMGIPAICISACSGGKCHTREEWLDIASLVDGCRFFMDFLAGYVVEK